MSLLFETIRIQDGEIQNLKYHERRANQSRAILLGSQDSLKFEEVLTPPAYFQKGLVKARISFAEQIDDVAFSFYSRRKISTLKKAHSDQISYSHKFENRKALKALFDLRQGHSEILIIKNNLVTDCFYYNVAFYNGQWHTPKTCLLHGTMRQSLIDQKKLIETEILEKDIHTYTKIALFNALTPFGEIELNVKNIY